MGCLEADNDIPNPTDLQPITPFRSLPTAIIQLYPRLHHTRGSCPHLSQSRSTHICSIRPQICLLLTRISIALLLPSLPPVCHKRQPTLRVKRAFRAGCRSISADEPRTRPDCTRVAGRERQMSLKHTHTHPHSFRMLQKRIILSGGVEGDALIQSFVATVLFSVGFKATSTQAYSPQSSAKCDNCTPRKVYNKSTTGWK